MRSDRGRHDDHVGRHRVDRRIRCPPDRGVQRPGGHRGGASRRGSHHAVVSHPNVYAAGDAVHAIGDNGRPLPMSCGSAGFTGRQPWRRSWPASRGARCRRQPCPFRLVHLSLGRRDAILQTYDGAAQPKPKSVMARKTCSGEGLVVRSKCMRVTHPRGTHRGAGSPLGCPPATPRPGGPPGPSWRSRRRTARRRRRT